MFTIRKMIDSTATRRLVICSLLLCPALLALSAAASPADRTAQPSGLLLASGGIIVNSPEVIFPKPTPPPDENGLTTDGEKKA
jgi:hypothetical protein